MSSMIRSSITRFHHTSEQAFKCHAADLLRQGFKQIGTREFAPPDGGPIRVLTKKSRFGGLLRGGKSGEAKGGPPTRAMPVGRTGGFIGRY